MPRKVNYGVDYDEDYDDYEDYDYDYDYDVEDNGKAQLETNQENIRPRLWRCSICTYDNDQSMVACDICGVVRNPSDNMSSNSDKKSAPFQFDVPSPDDLVSNGLRSSKMASKANSVKLASSDVPPSVSETNGAVKIQSNATRTDGSSASMPKRRPDSIDESNYSLVNRDKAQSLASSLDNVSLNVKSKNVNADAGKVSSRAQYKPEKWMVPDQGESSLTQLNLAIVGHVDSGKSTLSGRLLHLLGRISQKEMHKYEKEAKLQGKGSFAYAWALDESAEERERGITMTVAVAYFDSKRYHVVVLDSPGHKDFVPNMISGATQADAAILVIDASVGSFEVGMDTMGGQTKEHAQLIRSFGVDHIIVAVNKMDAVDFSKERFDLIKTQVGTFLRTCGFKETCISWIPLSAMENQNLVAAASDDRLLSWYRGPYLLDAIDSLPPPTRDFSKPLLMPICDVIKSPSLGQVVACGKLEAGALRSGLKVLVMPSGDLVTVRSLERDSQGCSIARAGDNVSVGLQAIDGNRVMAGGVLCHPDFPGVQQVKMRTAPRALFYHLTSLRALDLSHTCIEKLPSKVGKLIHLRYLDLSYFNFEELPETVCDLYNLQTLNLRWCKRLNKLPKGMGKLINLRHLNIEYTDSLRIFPEGFGRLSHLRTLSKFIVSGNKEGCEIGELKNLNHLSGHLEITGLENITDVKEARKAELMHKNRLKSLDLVFSFGVKEVMEGVIEALQPHQCLEELQVYDYGGSIFPTWMMFLTKLKDLRLLRWENCVHLPPLGKLPSLEKLLIGHMNNLKSVGIDFLIGIDDIADDLTAKKDETGSLIVFPKLRELTFHFMEEWEYWDTKTMETIMTAASSSSSSSTTRITIMPCLRSLSLYDCPKLKVLPQNMETMPLEQLIISRCPVLEHRYQKDIGEDWSKISHIPDIQI